MLAVVDVRTQTRPITDQLAVVAERVDAGGRPPGMEVVLRDIAGQVAMCRGGVAGRSLLAGYAGFTEVHTGGRDNRDLPGWWWSWGGR